MKGLWFLFLWLAPVLALAPGDLGSFPKLLDFYGKPIDLAAVASLGWFLLFWFYSWSRLSGCIS